MTSRYPTDPKIAEAVARLLRQRQRPTRFSGFGATDDGFDIPKESVPTILVASDDARPEVKAMADYVCDGVDDHEEIQAAIDELPSNSLGARILLSEGLFSCQPNRIVLRGYQSLVGMGAGTYLTDDSYTGAEQFGDCPTLFFEPSQSYDHPIDGSLNQSGCPIPGQNRRFLIGWDGGALGGQVFEIDDTGQIIRTVIDGIDSGGGGGETQGGITTDGDVVWVAHLDGTLPVRKYSLATGQFIGTESNDWTDTWEFVQGIAHVPAGQGVASGGGQSWPKSHDSLIVYGKFAGGDWGWAAYRIDGDNFFIISSEDQPANIGEVTFQSITFDGTYLYAAGGLTEPTDPVQEDGGVWRFYLDFVRDCRLISAEDYYDQIGVFAATSSGTYLEGLAINDAGRVMLQYGRGIAGRNEISFSVLSDFPLQGPLVNGLGADFGRVENMTIETYNGTPGVLVGFWFTVADCQIATYDGGYAIYDSGGSSAWAHIQDCRFNFGGGIRLSGPWQAIVDCQFFAVGEGAIDQFDSAKAFNAILLDGVNGGCLVWGINFFDSGDWYDGDEAAIRIRNSFDVIVGGITHQTPSSPHHIHVSDSQDIRISNVHCFAGSGGLQEVYIVRSERVTLDGYIGWSTGAYDNNIGFIELVDAVDCEIRNVVVAGSSVISQNSWAVWLRGQSRRNVIADNRFLAERVDDGSIRWYWENGIRIDPTVEETVLRNNIFDTAQGDTENGTTSVELLDEGSDTHFTDAILLPFTVAGTLSVAAGTVRMPVVDSYRILDVAATVGTAPVGADLIVDVHVSGVTAFTTQADRPTIPAGSTDAARAYPTDPTYLRAGDVVTVDVDQVGSTTPGSDLQVVVRLVPALAKGIKRASASAVVSVGGFADGRPVGVGGTAAVAFTATGTGAGKSTDGTVGLVFTASGVGGRTSPPSGSGDGATVVRFGATAS